ncbi:hypothetical protein [Qipengyuania sp.]|uniref:hypothetical protein n=1 Tax=Qipengyuania sp. TaxID=2004515 RepID=UPI0035C81441
MSAYTPNLPALAAAIPDDAARPPQTGFDRAKQVAFIEQLSLTGSVRAAAAATGVSHQSAYRARRSCRHLRVAWDAALVVARVHVADVMGCRALDGVEEKVFYKGEEVGSRTRYSDRLLLAHLARLDKLVESPEAAAYAENWDECQDRLGRGEAPVAAQDPDETSPYRGMDFRSGPWSKWSMSPPLPEEETLWTEDDWRVTRYWEEMMAQRPDGAPPPEVFADLAEAVRCQAAAFEMGDESWWFMGEDYNSYVRDGRDQWHPEPSDDCEDADEAHECVADETGSDEHEGDGAGDTHVPECDAGRDGAGDTDAAIEPDAFLSLATPWSAAPEPETTADPATAPPLNRAARRRAESLRRRDGRGGRGAHITVL